MKVALLSSYTTEFLLDEIWCDGAGSPIRLDTFELKAERVDAPFGQFREQIINNDSDVHRAKPDVLILALRGEDMLAQDEAFFDLLREAEQRFASALILVHNGVLFDPVPLPLLAASHPDSPGARLAALNVRLHERAAGSSRVRVLDLAALFVRHGAATLLDRRMMYVAKYPFSAEGTRLVARQIVHALAARAGLRHKCIVLDLDNTLWGGVLGEDGPAGLLLSDDGPGKAYQDFQKALLRIQQTGVLLAICSKNDEGPALDILRKHPGMVLRPEHFAGWRINWTPKPENLAALADELNLGLSSFLFLDDSAQERALVKQMQPDVFVPEVPPDPADLAAFLSDLGTLDTLSVTDSDRKRTQTYAQERQRKEARSSFGSMEDYIRSLGIRLTVSRVGDFTLPRAAQLTQRTNQFNLTTRRYTEDDLRAMRGQKDALLLLASAKDTFGDAGIVGFAIARLRGAEAHLDTFLMSCRVLGRRIEDAFLAAVLRQCVERGAAACIAEYLPTERNGMAKDFLPRSGFQAVGEQYRLDLRSHLPRVSGIEVIYE